MYTPAQMRAVMRKGILMVQKQQQQRISSTSSASARRQRQEKTQTQILPTKKKASFGGVEVAAVATAEVQETLRCIQRDVAYLRRQCDIMALAAKTQQEEQHATSRRPRVVSDTAKAVVPPPMTNKKRLQPEPARKVRSKHVDLDFLHDL
mmetsp:Transcript_60085/g.69603  ORF Transcript_60085/g.69603 Transcript_60085/m.69603 type:complete len:150 (+) Transcript_60085:73-522(+)